ncbi:MAG: GxGYxYP domain-containing protein [Anaerolineae bacterium]|jgi:hypothetical protein|nr:GxGYxYP domain-containing protein [Anaerolineae bacterium]
MKKNNTMGRNASWDADKTFFTKRLPLADACWVVDMKGASTAEVLFMRTMQGTLNKNKAQVYLINTDSKEFGEADRFWIEEYQRQGWVTIAGRLTIEAAIEKFASQLDGFITTTENEPWSIHAATVIAILNNGVVAPDAVASRLKAAGWTELDNTCGRWDNAVSAFNEMVEKHRDDLAYPGMALLRPTENLWDFVIQQQIMPMFSRPKHDTWEGVAKIMDTYPPKHILYGYVSDDTVEEEIAVERASSTGKYLVPTSQVSNLSFHSAVLGQSPLQSVKSDDQKTLPALDTSKVNVAICITDGDNLQVPIMQYPTEGYWISENRGAMPLGWSMGVSLSTLAPGIWEYYRSSVQPNDEIVSIMGIAYVHASTLPEPEEYFRATFASMKDMGLTTLWSLDSSLAITDEPLWDVLEGAPSRESLKGVLVGYGPSIDKAFRRETGTPVLITQNGYSDNAQIIKERIERIIALDESERSPVNFLMSTNWNSTADELYAALKPLEEKGVRFLTPAHALALMPQIKGIARMAVNTEASPGMVLPVGAIQQFGSPILSSPTLAEINNPIPLPFQVVVEGPEEISAGETFTCTAMIHIPVSELANDFLTYRVLPVVEAYGLSEEFAAYAWMKLGASDIKVEIQLPDTLMDTQVIGLDANGVKANAAVVENGIHIELGGFISDSRSESPLIQVAVQFSASSQEAFEIAPESVAFEFSLTVGIGEEDGPLVGGVQGTMAGHGENPLFATKLKP